MCQKGARHFTQSLTEAEVGKLLGEHAASAIDIERMILQMKEDQGVWKKRIKEASDKNTERLKEIKYGRRETVGILYSLPDLPSGIMNEYNKHGELINTRELTDTERQTRAFVQGKGGSTIPNPDEANTQDIDHEEIKDPEAAAAALYAGPQIAGMADKPLGEAEQAEPAADGADDAGSDLEDNGRSESVPQSEEDAASPAEVSEAPTAETAAPATTENGMAWDDPRQTRFIPDGASTEDGAKTEKKKRGRPAKDKAAAPEEQIPAELQGEEDRDEM